MRNLAWLLAVAAAGVGGYLLNESDAPAPRSTRPAPAPSVEPPPRVVSTDEPAPEPDDGADVRARVERKLKELLGDDVDPEHVAAAVAEARRMQQNLRAAAERAAHTVAERIADDVRQERSVLEETELSGMLRSIGSKRTRVPSLVADGAGFGALFERAKDGPILFGPAGEAPLDGAIVRYPAGAHAFDAAAWNRLAAFPPDVVVEGVGMNSTLLRLNEALSPRTSVRTLTIRDLTIDCNEHYLTDVGDPKPFVLRLARVRVVGFDSGTGRSVMFKVRHGALYANGCFFEAGYGRAPGTGTLFRVNQALLVRLEDCTIRGPFARLFDVDAGASYHFFRCALDDLNAEHRGLREHPPGGVRLEECRFDYRPENTPFTRRKLADLHPDWAR